ncbi:MAG: MFS transporter [Anaerolineae bacterium]
MMERQPSAAALRARDYFFINCYWFGLTFLWNGLHTIILPAVLLEFVPEHRKATSLGMMTFAGLLLAMLIQPLSGALSDAAASRWGRRRPWIAVGAAGTLLSLLALGLSKSFLFLAISYVLLQYTSNLAHGPLQGLIPDLVPPARHGTASGAKNILDLAGFIAGAMTAGWLVDRGQSRLALAVTAGVLLAMLICTLLGVREPPARGEHLPLRQLLRQALRRAYYFDVRRYPAYAWLLAARFCVLAGIYGVQSFGQYFIRDVLRSPNPAGATAVLMTTIGVGVALLVFPAGYLSDRLGRRWWNIIATVLCGLGVVLLLRVRSMGDVYLAGAVLGAGLGSFLSVNWALATDLVPPEEAGKYLGLSNFATAGAGATARLAGPLVDFFNLRAAGAGYQALFMLASAVILFGAFLIWWKVPETRPASRLPAN